jgi:excisionase family DNA binding protein
MNKKALTTYEIADHCQVNPRTVIQWINDGKLKAYRTPGNHSRVQIEDFLAFLNMYHMPLPVEFESPANRKRILIVDDDKSMVDAIQRILKREKIYDCELAYDGFEAGEKFVAFRPDLIIMDINMSGFSGYHLCSRIKSNPENKRVKILLISGIIDQKDVIRIKESGADDYLAKPFAIKELKEKLQNLFGWTRRTGDQVENEGEAL